MSIQRFEPLIFKLLTQPIVYKSRKIHILQKYENLRKSSDFPVFTGITK